MDKYRQLLSEKKQVFKEFHAEWNEAIEVKFRREMAKFPDKDPRFVLDRISHDYLLCSL